MSATPETIKRVIILKEGERLCPSCHGAGGYIGVQDDRSRFRPGELVWCLCAYCLGVGRLAHAGN